MADPIVVDFEGFADKRPVLAGILVDGAFQQFAFVDVEPGIETAARARRVECTAFASFCAELVARARCEGRGIAGFSNHERDEIAAGLGGCCLPMSSTSMPSGAQKRGDREGIPRRPRACTPIARGCGRQRSGAAATATGSSTSCGSRDSMFPTTTATSASPPRCGA
jgi:hypothetical protein